MAATVAFLLLFAVTFQTTTAILPHHPPGTFPNGKHDAKNRPTLRFPDPQGEKSEL